MKKLTLYIPLLFLASCGTTESPGPVTGENKLFEKEVQQSYERYKTAVANGNGAEVLSLVSNNTILYYGSLIDMVKNADSSKLETANLLEKFSVLAIRHSVDWGMLRAMDGQSLLMFAIENGMIGRETARTAIGSVKLRNESLAAGELVLDGRPTGNTADFYWESGRWKVDLTAVLKANEIGLKKMLSKPNLTENQSILLTLKETFGKEPGREIWQPANSNAK